MTATIEPVDFRRVAIQEANFNPASDTIEFDIAGCPDRLAAATDAEDNTSEFSPSVAAVFLDRLLRDGLE